MTRFSVGDQVIIRYGRHQGQKATIIKTQQADVYEVRVEDGSVLFFSGKGLDKESNDSNGAFVESRKTTSATVVLSKERAKPYRSLSAGRRNLGV